MSTDKPYYKLQQLMLQKYGQEKYNSMTAHKLVASWLNTNTGNLHKHSAASIMQIAALRRKPREIADFTAAEKQWLRKLFGLNAVTDLYTTEPVTDTEVIGKKINKL